MGDLRLLGFISLVCVSMLIAQAWQKDYGTTAKPSATTLDNMSNDQASISGIPAEPVLSPRIQENNTQNVQSNQSLAQPPVAGFENTSARDVSIENSLLRIKINLTGGNIVNSELLQYSKSLEDKTPITLLNETARRYFIAKKSIIFELENGSANSEKFVYKIADKITDSVTLFWESNNAPGLRLERRISFNGETYQIKVEDKVINNTKGYYRLKSNRELERVYNSEDHQNMFMQTFTGGVFHNTDEKYEKFDMKALSKGELDKQSANAWIAMIQHYFGTAWLPMPEELNTYYSGGTDHSEGYRYRIGFTSTPKDVQVGQTYTSSTTLFVGPKIQEKLEEAAEGLGLIVDFGIFTPISQPLFTALNFIHKYVGNWGWAIVLLTFAIKIIFFYPSQISYKSMAKMREAQPKMQAIRDRYGDDRQRQGKAMMELYKKEKINPAAGCLPMLIQIPVFISLYWALLESVELRQAPWALWIQDLSAKDPFYILPLIYGATMYVQQKLNPQPTDPIQAKVFTYLPVVFTVFFMFFPVGLVLYWITNNILTIAQQWYIYKFVVKKK